jgi:hypothetical protein
MPIAGLEVFGAIGKAEAAYFELINERGRINGRKVRFSHMTTNPIRRPRWT